MYLTFDDGPHPNSTPQILDTLQRHAALATFFVVGQQAAEHPDLIRRIAAAGHGVGGHSYLHLRPGEVTSRQLLAELQQTDAVLRPIVGHHIRLFRPPYGKLTAGKLLRLWLDRRAIVLWNQDPKDFACESRDELLGWFRKQPLSSGDIVLLHDTVSNTAAALEDILLLVRKAGLNFAKLGP